MSEKYGCEVHSFDTRYVVNIAQKVSLSPISNCIRNKLIPERNVKLENVFMKHYAPNW